MENKGYADFGGQTRCIMGNVEMVNTPGVGRGTLRVTAGVLPKKAIQAKALAYPSTL